MYAPILQMSSLRHKKFQDNAGTAVSIREQKAGGKEKATREEGWQAGQMESVSKGEGEEGRWTQEVQHSKDSPAATPARVQVHAGASSELLWAQEARILDSLTSLPPSCNQPIGGP